MAKKKTQKEIEVDNVIDLSSSPFNKIEVVKEDEVQNKPTPEQVAQYKLDFDDAIAKFTETRFVISEPGSFRANEMHMFLMNYLKEFGMWSKTGWMGVIKMEEELNNAVALNTEKGLSLDYQSLEFCGYMLMNPGGIGYDSAIKFEKMADQYAKVMTVIGEKVEEARALLQSVQYLQEKWAAGEQGFFLAELEPKDTPEGCDCEADEQCDCNNSTGIVIDATKTSNARTNSPGIETTE